MTLNTMLHTMSAKEVSLQMSFDMASNEDWVKEVKDQEAAEAYFEAKRTGGRWESGAG